MNTKHCHRQTARLPLQIIKALGLAISLLLLNSIAASPAQQIKRHIIISIDLVKEQQGKCPGYDSVVQIFIDDVKQESYQAAVVPGSHKLSVNTPKEYNIIIKEIRYEDWDIFKYPDGSSSAIPKTQTFTPNAPEATVSITAQPPNITSASQAQQPARLEIYWACQWTAAPPETFTIRIGWLGDDLQAMFGDTPTLEMPCCLPKQAQVFAHDAKGNPVSGVQTQVYFDDVLIVTRETDQTGKVIFELNLPENLPTGRSTHILKAQAQKNNGPPVVKIVTVETARDQSTITVSLDPISGDEFSPGDAVRISGRVWSLANGLFMDPVKAKITVHEYRTEDQFQAFTDESGFFQVSPIVSANPNLIRLPPEWVERAMRERSFGLEASPVDTNRYADGRTEFMVRIKPKGQVQVTATTDKVVYGQGDSVVIAGNVSADRKPIAGTVSSVLSTNGSKAATASDPSGHFSLTMPLAATTSAPPGAIIPAIAGTHTSSIQAEAKGYMASSVTNAYFVVQELNPLCRAGRIAVASVVGNPNAHLPNKDVWPSALRAGDAVVQGMSVFTSGADKVTLAFDLGNGAYATVALNGGTSVDIGRYCQDASGKVTLYLKMPKPGQVAVNVSQPPGVSPNFQILTQTASITSVHTRYIVTVDRAGATHVAALDGVVRVGDPNGANSIDVPAGKLISVQTNQPPNKATITAIRGKLDPALASLLANGAPPSGSAFAPLVSARGHGGGTIPGAGPSGGPGMPPAGGTIGGLGPTVSRGAAGGGTTSPTTPQVGDLTGLWVNYAGGALYRVRQVGNRVYWSVDAGAGGSINVYVGEISGNTINGVWVDLPQSASYNTGQLNLRIDSNDHLTKVGENPCCYGAQEWHRQATTTSAGPPAVGGGAADIQQRSLPPAGAAISPGGATGAKLSVEPNTNRPGQDYRNFDLPDARPELCQAMCGSDAKCQAYTYVKPGNRGQKAHCWLKSVAPPPQPNSCCVSGVKGSK